MKDFNFKIPQNIQFGMGSLKKLPEILAENHSDNILLVSDRGLEKIGVVKKVQDIIEAAGLKCTSYLDVVPNPTVAVVNEATALYKECGATSIVALGGGSSMDVGKAVGVLVNYGGKITINRKPTDFDAIPEYLHSQHRFDRLTDELTERIISDAKARYDTLLKLSEIDIV